MIVNENLLTKQKTHALPIRPNFTDNQTGRYRLNQPIVFKIFKFSVP